MLNPRKACWRKYCSSEYFFFFFSIIILHACLITFTLCLFFLNMPAVLCNMWHLWRKQIYNSWNLFCWVVMGIWHCISSATLFQYVNLFYCVAMEIRHSILLYSCQALKPIECIFSGRDCGGLFWKWHWSPYCVTLPNGSG